MFLMVPVTWTVIVVDEEGKARVTTMTDWEIMAVSWSYQEIILAMLSY